MSTPGGDAACEVYASSQPNYGTDRPDIHDMQRLIDECAALRAELERIKRTATNALLIKDSYDGDDSVVQVVMVSARAVRGTSAFSMFFGLQKLFEGSDAANALLVLRRWQATGTLCVGNTPLLCTVRPECLVKPDGNTLLHEAVMFASTELVSWCLHEAGISPNVQNLYGQTPLHLLWRTRSKSADAVCGVLRMLVHAGAHTLARDWSERTPLDYAPTRDTAMKANVVQRARIELEKLTMGCASTDASVAHTHTHTHAPTAVDESRQPAASPVGDGPTTATVSAPSSSPLPAAGPEPATPPASTRVHVHTPASAIATRTGEEGARTIARRLAFGAGGNGYVGTPVRKQAALMRSPLAPTSSVRAVTAVSSDRTPAWYTLLLIDARPPSVSTPFAIMSQDEAYALRDASPRVERHEPEPVAREICVLEHSRTASDPQRRSIMSSEPPSSGCVVGAYIGPFRSSRHATILARLWRRRLAESRLSRVCRSNCDAAPGSSTSEKWKSPDAYTCASAGCPRKTGHAAGPVSGYQSTSDPEGVTANCSECWLRYHCPQRAGTGCCEYSAIEEGRQMLREVLRAYEGQVAEQKAASAVNTASPAPSGAPSPDIGGASPQRVSRSEAVASPDLLATATREIGPLALKHVPVAFTWLEQARWFVKCPNTAESLYTKGEEKEI